MNPTFAVRGNSTGDNGTTQTLDNLATAFGQFSGYYSTGSGKDYEQYWYTSFDVGF
jgi:hypothetical protein